MNESRLVFDGELRTGSRERRVFFWGGGGGGGDVVPVSMIDLFVPLLFALDFVRLAPSVHFAVVLYNDTDKI